MSLKGRQPKPIRRGKPCSVGALLTALPKPEAAALTEMLASPDWSDPMTLAALRDEGHEVPLQQLGTHRRQQCACPR